MAVNTERFALLITGDGQGAIRELKKVGDASERELGRATTATEKWSKKFTSAGAVMVAGSAIAAAGLYKTATAAGALELSVSRLPGIFGDAAKGVEAWARSANTIGLSDRAAVGFAASIGEAAVGLGLGSEEAAKLAPELIEVTTQLGLLAGMDPAAAVETVNAAMRGEYDSLQRLVPAINNELIVRNALIETHKKTAKELTAEEKTRSALELILKKGNATLGRSGDVMDSLAGQTAQAKASFDDLKTGIGAGVMPVVSDLLGGLNSIVGGFNNLSPGVKETAGSFATFATAGTAILGVTSLVAGQLLKMKDRFTTVVVEGDRATRTLNGFGKAGIAAGVGMASFAATTEILNQFFLNTVPDVERLDIAIRGLAESGGVAAGALVEEFGGDLDELGEKIKRVAGEDIGSRLKGIFTGDIAANRNAARELQAVDAALAGIIKTGTAGDIEVARAAYGQLAAAALEQGASLEEIVAVFPKYRAALNDSRIATGNLADETSNLTGNLGDAWLTTRRTALDIASAIDNVRDAQEDLADARADAAGTGENAMSAARREADAHRGLEDAYRSSADAAENLRDARQALAEFDGAEAGKLRGLEREQIVRRRVGNAAEARQKEIDLLRFDESSADERERLQEGVADAEDGVADAARRVSDAQRDVSDAAKARRDVQVEAAEKIEDAERQVESAALAVVDAYQKALEDGEGNVDVANAWKDALGETAKLFAPGSDLRTGLGMMLAAANPMGPFLPPAGWVPTTAAAPPGRAPQIVGGGGGGGGGGSWKAAGGPVAAGSPYVVGERGPELFVPRSSGQIIPTGQYGSHMSIVQNNQFVGGDVPTVTQLDAQNRKLGIRVALAGRRG